MGDDIIRKVQFKDVNLDDPFFDSLKESYSEFSEWFRRKSENFAYVMSDDSGMIQGFLYVKIETGSVVDVHPPLNIPRCLKVGTFKVNAHGTRLGERFVKKIFDEALIGAVHHCYVTVFEKHELLIDILKKFGFVEYGVKRTGNGVEKVFVKDFSRLVGDCVCDYPVVVARGRNKWLLAVLPKWHTRLFPDSILRTESSSIVEDLSHTNSIHKVYIAWMADLCNFRPGDVVIIYRTAEPGRSAEYSAVASSLCVLQEVRHRSTFASVGEFVDYSKKFSVFTEEELVGLYNNGKSDLCALKMTYNIAFPKRPTRHALIEDVGLSRDQYFGIVALDDEAFNKILKLGGCYEGIVVN